MRTRPASRYLQLCMLIASFALAVFARQAISEEALAYTSDGPLLVVGSINVDTTVHLDRLPLRSETKVALRPSPTLAVGGKGANQAVAAALLSAGTGRPAARFVCRLGDDAYLPWLRAELAKAGVDTSASRVVANTSTGAGIVWLDADGAATSVVLGGANTQGWSLGHQPADAGGDGGERAGSDMGDEQEEEAVLLTKHAAEVVAGGGGGGRVDRAVVKEKKAAVLLLQREVPEHVNEAFAAAAAAAGVPVLLDAGGENRPVSRRLLSLADFLAPNEQELHHLSGGLPTGTEEQVAAAAGGLMAGGACNVLVTLEARGSLLLLGEQEEEAGLEGREGERRHRRCRPVRAIRQPALPAPGGVVVDATAAGDAFRAALAVALVEGRGRPQRRGGADKEGTAQPHTRGLYEGALRLAAAAGAIAVSRMGAMPSLPTRAEVEALLEEHGASPAALAWDAPELLAAAARAAAATASATATSPGTAAPPAADDTIAASCPSADGSDAGACANPDAPAADAASGDTGAPAVAATAAEEAADAADEAADGACHQWLFGARLNSMKARRDLLAAAAAAPAISAGDDPATASAATAAQLLLRQKGPLGWVARQGLVATAAAGGAGGGPGGGAGCGAGPGLDLVYLNYPEHLEGLTLQQVTEALSVAGLRPGGVAMRFPAEPFRAGALTNPNATIREAAVALAVEGCAWAARLASAAAAAAGDGGGGGKGGGGHLVVWSAYDGYDYHLQADYGAAWSAALGAYRQLADGCAALGVAVSLEPKPTDPSSRFAFLPNTASALAFVEAVDRPNLGLTLDTGHMLMAGECLAASVAAVAAAGRLFGLHLNDGHSRLGAEDGLVYGSVHGAAALELVYYLRYKLPAAPAGPFSWPSSTSGRGRDPLGQPLAAALPHAFFDTFPLNEDPVAEAAANLASFGALWRRAGRLRRAGVERCLAAHDALCSLRLMAAVP